MFKFLGLKSLSNIKYLPKFFLDKNNSFYEKLESLIYIFLIISPVDIISEFIIGFGFIDDAIILVIFMNRILTNLDKYKKKSESENGKDVIDVEYIIKNDDADDDDDE